MSAPPILEKTDKNGHAKEANPHNWPLERTSADDANAECWLIGRSMAQVALAWLRHRMVPVIPIMGARKVSQLPDNLASLDLELSAEQSKSLDEASRIELGFPQSIYEREMVRSIRYGGTWDRLLLYVRYFRQNRWESAAFRDVRGKPVCQTMILDRVLMDPPE